MYRQFFAWCQQVLPTVYDDSLSYYELLNKLIYQLIDVVKQVDKNTDDIGNINEQLTTFITNDDAKKIIGEIIKNLIENGKLISNTVNISIFGAKGDGVTDDTESFVEGIAFCNEHGLTLTCNANETYKIQSHAEIQTKCNIDFNNSTLVLAKTNEEGYMLAIEPDSPEIIQLNAGEITQTGTTNQNLFGKTFRLTTPMFLGAREGGSGGNFYMQLVISCDQNGRFINTRLPYPLTGTNVGGYTADNIHKTEQSQITIKNANIKFEPGSYAISGLVRIQRNNVKINNITVDGNVEIDTTRSNFRGSLIRIYSCGYIEISNINGSTPLDGSHGGYVIYNLYSTNLHIHDCVLYDSKNDSWGCITAGQIVNTLIERCITKRIDYHYFFTGYYTVRDCHMQWYRYGGGEGIQTIENCVFTHNPDNGTNVIVQRTDLPIGPTGEFTVKNCQFEFLNIDDNVVNIINMAIRSGDTGVPSGRKLQINISGNVISLRNIHSLLYINPQGQNNPYCNVSISDMEITTNSAPDNPGKIIDGGEASKIASLTVTNCFSNGGGISPKVASDIMYVNCKLSKTASTRPNYIDNGSGNLMLSNCTLGGFMPNTMADHTIDNLIVTGCHITSDIPLRVVPTNSALHNNLVDGTNVNNLNSWNSGITRQ